MNLIILVFPRKTASDMELSEHFDKLGVIGSSPIAPIYS
jgi:hypothetical protein